MIAGNRLVFDASNCKMMTLFLVIFWTGALTLVGLTLGAFIAVVYLINLFLDAVSELAMHLSSLYSHTGSLGKILLVLVGIISFPNSPRGPCGLYENYISHCATQSAGRRSL
jgi:ABC-type multidrug transport system fused ATPase/permease subunit